MVTIQSAFLDREQNDDDFSLMLTDLTTQLIQIHSLDQSQLSHIITQLGEIFQQHNLQLSQLESNATFIQPFHITNLKTLHLLSTCFCKIL